MRLFFLHNVPIHILQHPSLVDMGLTYSWVTAYQPGRLASRPLIGSILLKVNPRQWAQLFNEISQLSINKVTSISILLPEGVNIDLLFQQYFKPTRSAGGIVTQGENVLMIYRSHVWDLPKGKIEMGETPATAAAREVQEECGVQALVKEEFFTTWHAFQLNQTYLLKETTWYIMDCLNDAHMAPQQEEAIQQVKWVHRTQLPHMCRNTYASIQLLLQAYQNYLSLHQKSNQ